MTYKDATHPEKWPRKKPKCNIIIWNAGRWVAHPMIESGDNPVQLTGQDGSGYLYMYVHTYI